MAIPPPNPHSKWYHCLCCYPTKSVDSGSKSVESIPASPAGHWGANGFQAGHPPVNPEFKKEFEGK